MPVVLGEDSTNNNPVDNWFKIINYYISNVKFGLLNYAGVVKLVDTPALGAGRSNPVQVQFLSPAPI